MRIYQLFIIIFTVTVAIPTLAKNNLDDFKSSFTWKYDNDTNLAYIKNEDYFLSLSKFNNKLFIYFTNYSEVSNPDFSILFNVNELKEYTPTTFNLKRFDTGSNLIIADISLLEYFKFNYLFTIYSNDIQYKISLKDSTKSIQQLVSNYQDFIFYLDYSHNTERFNDLIGYNLELYKTNIQKINDSYYLFNYFRVQQITDNNFDYIEIIKENFDCRLKLYTSKHFTYNFELLDINSFSRELYQNFEFNC